MRELNQLLHHELAAKRRHAHRRAEPERCAQHRGRHRPSRWTSTCADTAGYYLGGMNKFADLTVHGNVGWGVAENMMSGSVRVKGFASESAGATGHGGLLVIEGDASLRCGISMKGIDIVVGGSVGNFSAFMAQAGTLVVCGDAGDALGDSLYEAVLYVRGTIKSLGADATIEPMTAADRDRLERAAETRRVRPRPDGVQARRVMRGRCTTGMRMRTRSIDCPTAESAMHNHSPEPSPSQREESASFDRSVIDYIQHAAATGLYEIRGLGAKRHVPHFDDLVFLAGSASRYPLEGYREKCHTKTVLGTRFAKKPIELAIPITFAGMSFGSLSANVKEALGRAATELGTSHHHRRRRDDPGGAAILEDAGLPVPALALRLQPRRPAPGRRHRGRDRAGRQARWRRHAAGPEDQPARGRDAHAACGHRPALGLPAPRLDRAGRPGDQDQRAARDHRLEGADLREDRRDAHLQRREAGGARRCRCGRGRRHAGRHRGDADGVHRARRASRRWRRCARRWMRSRRWTCAARCSSSSPAAFAPAPTWRKRSRWARMRFRSGRARLFALGCNNETYFQNGEHHVGRCRLREAARTRRATAITATPANARSASPPRTRCWNSASSRRWAPGI